MAIEKIRQVSGRALPLRGDNIDTDRIIPARFLRSITFEGLEQHLFEDDRKQLVEAGATHPLDKIRYAGAAILLVNANFGCGSRGARAPGDSALRHSRGRGRIVFGNLLWQFRRARNAVRVVGSATLKTLMQLVESDPSTEFSVDLDAMGVSTAGSRHAITLPAAARESFLDGTWDATGLLLDRFEEVEAVAARLPYVSGSWR